MNHYQSLLADLEMAFQAGPLPHDPEGYLQLDFEGGLVVTIRIEEERGEVVLFSKVGEAPDHDPDFAEELLSSNLFWRDTDGATLSLERYSRCVILAKSIPFAQVSVPGSVVMEVRRFVEVAGRWITVIPRMTSPDPQSPRSDLLNAATRGA